MQSYQMAFRAFHETLDIVRTTGGRAGESATLHNIGKHAHATRKTNPFVCANRDDYADRTRAGGCR